MFQYFYFTNISKFQENSNNVQIKIVDLDDIANFKELNSTDKTKSLNSQLNNSTEEKK